LEESSELLNHLLYDSKEWHGSLLVPTNDASLDFIIQNRESLTPCYIIPLCDSEIISNILNKGKLYSQAQKTGIPIPKVSFPDGIAYLEEHRKDLRYPCILKPFETHKFRHVFREKMIVINNFDELIKYFMEAERHNLSVMVVEIIPGLSDCLYHYRSFVDRDGNVLAEMCTQKLRQYPAGYGEARMSKTIPVMDEIKHLTLKLLKSYPFCGFSSAEYKYDQRDKQYKLMEINIRSVTPERLFTAAGINFSYISYLYFAEQVVRYVKEYKSGIYWINEFADVLEFLRGRRDGNCSFKEYLRPYFSSNIFAVSFFDDPLPFLATSCTITKNLGNGLYNKLRTKLLKRVDNWK
jgi:predicted ATP-grasp superfamily ATP-dependent carboligase